MINHSKIAVYRALRKLGVKRDEIVLESKFNKDLFFDDMDLNCLLFLVESHLNINLDNASINQSNTISDLVDLVDLVEHEHCGV